MDSDYLFYRLENPADAVSPYPSFYEGPRLDINSTYPVNRDEKDRRKEDKSYRDFCNDDCTLWVGNIDLRISETMVFELFSQVGDIRDISFPKHPHDGEKSAGFCFVNFMLPDSVPRAIQVMQGTVLFGRKLFLKCRPDSIHAIRTQQSPSQATRMRATKRILRMRPNPNHKFENEGQRENEFLSEIRPHSSTRRVEEREENVQNSKYSPIRAPTPDGEGVVGYSNRFNPIKSLKGFQQGTSDNVRDNQRRHVVFRPSSGSVLPVVNIKTFPQPKISSVVITPPPKPKPTRSEAQNLPPVSSLASTQSPSHGKSLPALLSSPRQEKSEERLKEKVECAVAPKSAPEKYDKSVDVSKDNESRSSEEKAQPQQIQTISTVFSTSKTRPRSSTTPTSYFNRMECYGFNYPLHPPNLPSSTYTNNSPHQGTPFCNQIYQSQGIPEPWIPSSSPAPHLNLHFRPPAPNSYINRYQYPPRHPNCWQPHVNYNSVQHNHAPRYAYVRPNYFSQHYPSPLSKLYSNQESQPTYQPSEIQSTNKPSYTAPHHSHLSTHHNHPSSNTYTKLTPEIRSRFSRKNRSPTRRTPRDKFSRIERSRSSSRSSSRVNYQRCRSSSRESNYRRYSSRSPPSRRLSPYYNDIYNKDRSSSSFRRSSSRSLSHDSAGKSSSKNNGTFSPDPEPDPNSKKRSSSTSTTSSSSSPSSQNSKSCRKSLEETSQKRHSRSKLKSKTRREYDKGNSPRKANSSRSYDTQEEYDPSDPGY